jgi:hypothetical protein
MNRAKASAASFMDTLKGFLNKDSSSEDELGLPPTVPALTYPQARNIAETNSVTAICADAKISLFSEMLTDKYFLERPSINIDICRSPDEGNPENELFPGIPTNHFLSS